MDVVNLGRRALLRAGGGAGLFGALAPALTEVTKLPGLAPTTGAVCGESVGAPTADPFWTWHQHRERKRLGLNGFDPDLASLRSISPAVKSIMQAKRDLYDESAWEKIKRGMLGNS